MSCLRKLIFAGWFAPSVGVHAGCFALLYFLLSCAALAAQTAASDANETARVAGFDRQSLEEAWWTGPMLAPSGTALPVGRLLVEPYLYDVASARGSSFGSLTYLVYGLAERFSVGAIPVFSFNTGHGEASTSGPRLGDLTLQAQYQVTQYSPGRWLPSSSIVIQETLPTGKFDRLGGRVNEGTGSGAYMTTLAVFSQSPFWLPNGRIVRVRLDLSRGISRRTTVEDDSVYGTTEGFRGYATPGKYFLVDAAAEYSLTREWVLAFDLIYRRTADTRVAGSNAAGALPPAPTRVDVHTSPLAGMAPAIEYNWHANFGLLLGTRLIPRAGGTGATITPAIAVNCVF